MVISKVAPVAGNPDVIVEMEIWGNVDETGKARTRVNIKGNSVVKVTKELTNAAIAINNLIGVPESLPEKEVVTAEPEPEPEPEPVKKTSTAKKTYSAGGKKPYTGKKGRTLNKELDDIEPETCPDCDTPMVERFVTKKNGSRARLVECPLDKNVYWDNTYRG